MKDNMNWGVIGNCKTAAIVNKEGSIIWACIPDFDSPSAFASILDSKKGGQFSISVGKKYSIDQEYVKNTNILITRFSNGDDIFEIHDFLPRYKINDNTYHCPPDIIRYFKHIRGRPKFKINYDPKLGYAQGETKTTDNGKFLKSVSSKGQYESIYLYSNLDLKKILDGEEIAVKKDLYFLLSYNQKLLELSTEKVYLELERTKVYWLNWVSKTATFSKYQDEINRSSLILKLLSCQNSGAILASITTSLPEKIKGERNWDYRYCWIRDTSMTINVLLKLNHYEAARSFLKFIIDVIPYKDERVQIMYGIRGQKRLTERTLDWLDGYQDSKPVRVGNAAYSQKQNDIYGVLLDVIYKYIKFFSIDVEYVEELWTITRGIIKTVKNNWKRPDVGIWEYRKKKQHFVFSKVLCWVALDRGIKIAELLFQSDEISDWKKCRKTMKENILTKGYSEEKGYFTQSYENKELDAANLLMADYGFISVKDPKFIKTVLATQKELCQDGLMFRYKNEDDFGVPSSSFTICSFWLIKALSSIGKNKEAIKSFEKLLSYSNHLGLFSEGLDFKTKRLLGNFPQGYSHLALIDTAINCSNQKLEDEKMTEKVIEKIMSDNIKKNESPS